MAKLMQKPTLSSVVEVGKKGVAATVGFMGYDEVKKLSPIEITPMHEAGAVIGATVVAAATKNTLLQIAMLGVILSAGISSAQGYGLLPASQVAVEETTDQALEGLGYDSQVEVYNPYENVENVEDYSLTGIEEENVSNFM